MNMKIKDLRNLPVRKWDEESLYSSILVIPSGKKHESGFALMYIIGMNGDTPVEIAAACDDLCWIIPEKIRPYELRTDMFYNGGVLRFRSYYYDFKVGNSLSSTNVYLVKKHSA